MSNMDSADEEGEGISVNDNLCPKYKKKTQTELLFVTS